MHLAQNLIIYKLKEELGQVSMKKQRKPKEKINTKTKAVSKSVKPKYKEKVEEEPMKELPSPYKYTIEDQSIKISLHNNYQIKEGHQLFADMPKLFKLYVQKQNRRNHLLYALSQYSYFPHFQFILAGEKPQENKCSICQFEFDEMNNQEMEKQLLFDNDGDLVILKCTHVLHFSCLQMLIGENKWFKCPVCATIYGKMIGDQPPGDMAIYVNEHMHCDGYYDCGTIVIDYNMHSGKRGTISFPGTHRTAYLPDNPGGRQVLDLLRQAFNRKLIFTVGRSVTTGRDNQIVWNGVHHKTNTTGGSSHFGYPDPTYFDRVKLELAAKGIK